MGALRPYDYLDATVVIGGANLGTDCRRAVDKDSGRLTRLSISTRLLDNLATAGELPRIKIGTKTLFRVADLDDFIESKICNFFY